MSMQVSTSQANDEQKTARTASKAKHKLRRGEVFAKYTPSDIPEWAGNQFIECLGRVPTDEELATIMAYKPPYDEAERQRPANVRKQFLEPIEARIRVALAAACDCRYAGRADSQRLRTPGSSTAFVQRIPAKVV